MNSSFRITCFSGNVKREFEKKERGRPDEFYLSKGRARAPTTAPEPTNSALSFGEETISVDWGSGHLTMCSSAFQKLPKEQQNKFTNMEE